MSTINNTDTFLVNRGSSSYKITAANLMSTILDTDLLLINRGSTSYKVTAADLKGFASPSGLGEISSTGSRTDPNFPQMLESPNSDVGWLNNRNSLFQSSGNVTYSAAQGKHTSTSTTLMATLPFAIYGSLKIKRVSTFNANAGSGQAGKYTYTCGGASTSQINKIDNVDVTISGISNGTTIVASADQSTAPHGSYARWTSIQVNGIDIFKQQTDGTKYHYQFVTFTDSSYVSNLNYGDWVYGTSTGTLGKVISKNNATVLLWSVFSPGFSTSDFTVVISASLLDIPT